MNGELEIVEPFIVGITGYAGAGKDAAASVLIDVYDFTRVAFADPMKRDMTVLDPIIDGSGLRLSHALENAGGSFEDVKRRYPELRRLLQHYGTEVWRSIDKDIWVKRLIQTINDDFDAGRGSGRYVVPDMRFLNEHALVNWATTIRIENPRVQQNYEHASEAEIPFLNVDHVINNNYDLPTLAYLVEDVVLDVWKETHVS